MEAPACLITTGGPVFNVVGPNSKLLIERLAIRVAPPATGSTAPAASLVHGQPQWWPPEGPPVAAEGRLSSGRSLLDASSAGRDEGAILVDSPNSRVWLQRVQFTCEPRGTAPLAALAVRRSHSGVALRGASPPPHE